DLFREGSERPIAGLIERGRVAEQSLDEHLAGPEGLTAMSNTFDEWALLQELAASARQGALVSEVRGRAERFTERADVLRTHRDAFSFSTRREWRPPGPARACWRPPSRRARRSSRSVTPDSSPPCRPAAGWAPSAASSERSV